MTKHSASSNHEQHGNNRGNRSSTPPRHNDSPPRSPVWSDEDDFCGPLSRNIMRAPIPSGFEK
ncbi:hypothetical protein A2U01_0083642, partial [Trifolium medium]|nr:hypothetical protein [Trifolium medium]